MALLGFVGEMDYQDALDQNATKAWSVPGIGLTTKIWGLVVKLNEQQMQEAVSFKRGVDTWSIFNHGTLRHHEKILRQYERYGESTFTPIQRQLMTLWISLKLAGHWQ